MIIKSWPIPMDAPPHSQTIFLMIREIYLSWGMEVWIKISLYGYTVESLNVDSLKCKSYYLITINITREKWGHLSFQDLWLE